MLRQGIISVIGLLIIAGGYFGKQKMASKTKPERPKEVRSTPIVFTQEVKNTNTPISVKASGNLAARDRIEIFAEVQGIFESSQNRFKPGVYYKEGDLLIQLNSDELRANLKAQKSQLYNQIVSILPDLRFDYPDAFQKWESYANAFNVEDRLKALPTSSSDREKLFIASKPLGTTWYTIKNLEERLSKYSIYAPFSGILTESNVDKGALVRGGQKLGEFINPSHYELEVALNSSYADLLKVGSTVSLTNVEGTKTWSGKVSRLNSLIDPNTQTLQAYIKVNGKGLREGMYLEAKLKAKNEANTFEVSRKLIVDNNKVYMMKGEQIFLQEVEIVHFTETTAIIRGLKDGSEILERSLPGSYDGMTVKRYEE